MSVYDIEQDILLAWGTSEDLKLLQGLLEEADDNIQNTLLGIISLHNLRMEKVFSSYEKLLKDRANGNNVQRPVDSFTVSV